MWARQLTLPQKASTKNDELLLLLKNGLPTPIQQIWHRSPSDIEALFETGSFTLPENAVLRALKSKKINTRGWETYKFQNHNYFAHDRIVGR